MFSFLRFVYCISEYDYLQGLSIGGQEAVSLRATVHRGPLRKAKSCAVYCKPNAADMS